MAVWRANPGPRAWAAGRMAWVVGGGVPAMRPPISELHAAGSRRGSCGSPLSPPAKRGLADAGAARLTAKRARRNRSLIPQRAAAGINQPTGGGGPSASSTRGRASRYACPAHAPSRPIPARTPQLGVQAVAEHPAASIDGTSTCAAAADSPPRWRSAGPVAKVNGHVDAACSARFGRLQRPAAHAPAARFGRCSSAAPAVASHRRAATGCAAAATAGCAAALRECGDTADGSCFRPRRNEMCIGGWRGRFESRVGTDVRPLAVPRCCARVGPAARSAVRPAAQPKSIQRGKQLEPPLFRDSDWQPVDDRSGHGSAVLLGLRHGPYCTSASCRPSGYVIVVIAGPGPGCRSRGRPLAQDGGQRRTAGVGRADDGARRLSGLDSSFRGLMASAQPAAEGWPADGPSTTR